MSNASYLADASDQATKARQWATIAEDVLTEFGGEYSGSEVARALDNAQRMALMHAAVSRAYSALAAVDDV